jgi:hypothetical protein
MLTVNVPGLNCISILAGGVRYPWFATWMSIPAHGRLLPISIIDESHIGEKLRLFGILRLSDNIDTLAVLSSSKGGGERKGILVDLSVPIIEINETGSGLLRESGAVVMVMGTVERNLVCEFILDAF